MKKEWHTPKLVEVGVKETEGAKTAGTENNINSNNGNTYGGAS